MKIIMTARLHVVQMAIYYSILAYILMCTCTCILRADVIALFYFLIGRIVFV